MSDDEAELRKPAKKLRRRLAIDKDDDENGKRNESKDTS